jgi:putative hydrolase of the HAD superfamily
MNPIRNIIFDFGDVFINLDKSAPERCLNELGVFELDKKTLRIHEDYEKGLFSTEEFIEYHTEKFPQLTDVDFISAWNSILKDFPKYRLDFLKEIKESEKFNLFLLSNTNNLHMKWVEENINFYKEFKSCFDVFYLSYEINLRKPNEDIFQFVLKQNNLQAQDTLFIDDTEEHIKSAKHLNIQTWHLQAGQEDIVDLFKQNNLNF